MKADWIRLSPHDSKGGRLLALQAGEDVPFRIERAFLVLQQDAATLRGQHAHRRGDELLVCLEGECTLRLDDGTSKEEFLLDRSDRALHVGPLQWEELRLSSGAVLLVLASTPYDRADYIHDYEEFRALVDLSA